LANISAAAAARLFCGQALRGLRFFAVRHAPFSAR
jgi:hypothetical protein